MSVFIIDPLRTERLVLHNQHFPIAGFFSPKLPLCKIRILYSFDKRINLPRAKLPESEGLSGSCLCGVGFNTSALPGAWLPLCLGEETPKIWWEVELMEVSGRRGREGYFCALWGASWAQESQPVAFFSCIISRVSLVLTGLYEWSALA